MDKRDINIVTMTVAILGAGKMILESFGVDLIDDNQINEIANGVAAVVTIVGVIISHRKTTKKETSANDFITPIEPSA